MIKRAVILSGGKGTRLKPYTVVLPKPLIPIGNYPILEVVIRQLARCGFRRITIAVNHQADLIKAFFGDGHKWGVEIDYSIEDQPLSTMGPLKLIKDLPDNFLVMNGDILTDLPYDRFFDYHVERANLFTISSCIREQTSEYGILETEDGCCLSAFKEKPTIAYEVSMGIYMVSNAILEYIPSGRAYGFDNLMLEMIRMKKEISVKRHDGYWLDIGRPDDYAQAIEEFELRETTFLK